ncbi:carboxylesterase family protein, partial [Bifidobacterium adolescentis]|uniref:carboxylesterase family protein n=2 Tax=Bifidobacterium TaxID=1678 RepID=UPI00319E0AF8
PYYYHFDVAMPGDEAGAFHSSDLWFSFGSLAKCWRPFVGWHYDLARRMGLYWTNFAANGDPNGTDRDGTPLPVWDPCIGEEYPAMHLCQEPGMRTDWLTETDRKAFGL